MSKKGKVLGFGDNVVDRYEHIKTIYPGGNCLNFAVYAKMIGVSRAAYMGYFGNDMEAEHVIWCLNKLKIETVKCRQLHGENGCARVCIEDGERIFLGSNCGGIRGKTPYILDRFDLEYMREFDLVHSGNYSFTEEELWKLKKAGIPVSFDFSEIRDEEYWKKVGSQITYAFLSCGTLSEEQTQECLEKIYQIGVQKAVATMGSGRAIGFDGKRFYYQEPVLLKDVTDTMGAGDSFITSFLVEEMEQKMVGKADMQRAMKEAARFAAKTCMMEGAFGYGKYYGAEHRKEVLC